MLFTLFSRYREPVAIKEAKKVGRKIVLVSQGTSANNELGKLLAPTILGLGGREDLLLLVTAGGKPIENIPCTLTPNTISSRTWSRNGEDFSLTMTGSLRRWFRQLVGIV